MFIIGVDLCLLRIEFKPFCQGCHFTDYRKKCLLTKTVWRCSYWRVPLCRVKYKSMIAILNNNGHYTKFIHMFNCLSNNNLNKCTTDTVLKQIA